MKLKCIVFGDGRHEGQRFVPGFRSRVPEIHVGMEVFSSYHGTAKVVSLELDRTARAVLIRKVDAADGTPSKGWDSRDVIPEHRKADALAVVLDGTETLLFDDDQPQGQQKQGK